MRAACPEIEALERYATSPPGTADAVSEHVSQCADCQGRLDELSRNLALFEELADAAQDWGEEVAAPAAAPTQIGEYAIVREIGRGGMGVVYEARQAQPQRSVALKVLRADHMLSDERRRLFEREIRVLARLRHPGITAIFGAGASEFGPYYAMELVQGVALTEFARTLGPDVRPRLRLFLEVCAAISYAHQHGVIHRDIKPGNILVEEGGSPKVLDFGLARITDADVTGPSLAMDAGRLVGTLAYMSPEQTRGEADAVDLRSDVYSLGVILFELLTGTLPYDVPRTSVVMAVRSICEAAPRRPSSVTSAGREEARRLQGDLDTIVLKALEKSPDARYQSVAALADDVERFLNDQPIVARPASTFYQLRKFARRNRVLVGGVLGVFVALTLGLIGTAWQAVRARQAEARALAESATNAEISRFMTTMFASVDPAAAGPDVRVVELLKRAAADIDGAFADQPRVAFALREAIGTAYRSLTLYADAEPHLKGALDHARREFGEESREALRTRYALTEGTSHLGKTERAWEDLQQLHEVQSRVLGPHDADTLTSLNFLAVLAALRGDAEESERIFRDTLSGRTKALGPQHDLTLATLENLGILLCQQGRRVEGTALMRQAYDAAVQARGPDHALSIPFAANLATRAETPAELEAVEPIFRDIVQRGARVYGPDHRQTLALMGSLAHLLELRVHTEESIALTRDLLARQKRVAGPRDGTTLDVLLALARRYLLNRQPAEGEAAARECLDGTRETFGDAHERYVDAMYMLTHALNDGGKLADALQLAQQTLERRIALNGESGAQVGLARSLMSDVLRKMSRLDEAEAASTRALQDLQVAPDTHPIWVAWAAYNLGACLRDAGCFVEAEAILRDAHEQLAVGLGVRHPITEASSFGVLELYFRWHTADPTGGHDRQASEWQDRRTQLLADAP